MGHFCFGKTFGDTQGLFPSLTARLLSGIGLSATRWVKRVSAGPRVFVPLWQIFFVH
jgi:hypothetical protein